MMFLPLRPSIPPAPRERYNYRKLAHHQVKVVRLDARASDRA
jgi:hypothetical protein